MSSLRIPCLGAVCVLSTAFLLTGVQAGDKQKESAPKKGTIVYRLNPSMQFDLFLIDARGKRHTLTYASEDGRSNNLVFFKIDDKMYAFGVKADAKLPPGLHGGKWVTKKEALGKGPNGKERLGDKSVWLADKMRITQTLEIVPSRDNKPDTCLITYLVENTDNKAHKVAMRVVVDVYVGESDAPAFAFPNKKELVTTSADLRGKDIPFAVKAMEKPNVKAPGVVGYFTLRFKFRETVNGPERFTITHFPTSEHIKDLLSWQIPVRNMKLDASDPGDGAVVMYWNAHELKGGGQRRMGFAYGGGVAARTQKTQK